MSNTDLLDIPGLDGGVFVPQSDGDFEVNDYSLGATVNPAGHPVYQPLIVNVGDANTPGANALAADAANLTVIPTMTLYVENSLDQAIEEITLTDATVVQAVNATGAATYAFDYQKISTTSYTPSPDGGAAPQTTITEDPSTNGGTFAAPPVATPSTTLPSDESLYLNVRDVTGPSRVPGFTGDFQPLSYEFAVGTDGTAGPLVVNLGAGADARGVATLYGDSLAGTIISPVTLTVQHTAGSGAVTLETITLADAEVTSYTDPSGDVSVTFNYASATIVSRAELADGSLGAAQTVKLTGSSTPPVAVGVVPAETGSTGYLSVPGIDGGVENKNFANDFQVTGYSLGATATGPGAHTSQPLTVTLAEAETPGVNALAEDAAQGTVIPTMTLEETNSVDQLSEKITLTNAVVVEVQQASGTAAFAVEYQTITTTSYTQQGAEAPVLTTTVTGSGGTFAAPTLPDPQAQLPSDQALYLNVTDVTGPSTGAGFLGDFQPTSYDFTVGPGGTAGPLVLDLGAPDSVQGVSALYADVLSGEVIPRVTLYVEDTALGVPFGTAETIALTDAVATRYTDPDGDVSVSFDYKTATVTSQTPTAHGTLGNPSSVTFSGPATPPTLTDIVPGSSATPVYLSIPGLDGGASARAFKGDFDVSAYSLGATAGTAEHPVYAPLVVTVTNPSTGLNTLAADEVTGQVIPTMTLGVYSDTDQLLDEITLGGARVVDVQQASGGTTVAFEYAGISTTTYLQTSGMVSATVTGVTNGDFTASSPVAPPTTLPAETALYLNVAGDTGPVSPVGFRGDFQPKSYQFAIGADGNPGPLTLDLGAGSNAQGVSTLYSDLFNATVIPTVTLYVEQTSSTTGATVALDRITLTDAVVTSYTDPGGDVSVSFEYAKIALTSQNQLGGVLGTPQTVTFTGQVACYGRGTRLRAATGEKAIEDLSVGESVMTASGALKPVRWLGWRSLDCRTYADPRVIWPIRVSAGAFGVNRPARDLWVSPGHAIEMDGSLFQAEKLINGATIVQEPRAHVEYWHIELEEHDLVLAEGLASESYLDTGNRDCFINGGAFVAAFPDFKPRHWNDTCLPLVFDGDALERAKAHLIERAKQLGYRITGDADLHAVADARRIEALRLNEARVAFVLPEASSVELRCRTFVPAHIDARSRDVRALGICVGRLQLDGADVPLDDGAVFATGWHAVERPSTEVQHRWTFDRVPIPAGTRLVVIDVASRSYYWTSPNAARVLAVA